MLVLMLVLMYPKEMLRSLAIVQYRADAENNADCDSKERGDADALAKKVRVLCWVMTGPDNHKTKVTLIILVIV